MSQITKGKVLDAAELCYDSDTGKLSYLARSGAHSSPAPRLAGGGVGLELGPSRRQLEGEILSGLDQAAAVFQRVRLDTGDQNDLSPLEV